MRLDYAKWILRQVDGKSATYMRQWGASSIKEAVRTVRDRVSSTREDHECADRVAARLRR
jgi:hypothetical protein